MAKKQFDYSKHVVADELQGMTLASFSRRGIAYGLDWLFVAIITSYYWLIVPTFLVWLIFKGKTKQAISKSSEKLKNLLDSADERLDSLGVKIDVRERFRRYMTVYIYVLIYLPIVLSIVGLSIVIGNWIAPDAYTEMKADFLNLGGRFNSLHDFIAGFNWVVGFMTGFFYFSLFTWRWKGQTPGKRLLGIRVRKLNGRQMTLYNSIERFTGYTASSAFLMGGFFQFFWDKNHQTTHDKITETVVMRASL